jgi:hypothetical protein
MGLASYVAFIGEKKNAYSFFWWGKVGKGLLGRPKRRGWDNIKLLLKFGWLPRARGRFMAVVNMVTNLRVS